MNDENVSYETIKTALSRVNDLTKVVVVGEIIKTSARSKNNGLNGYIEEKRNSQGE